MLEMRDQQYKKDSKVKDDQHAKQIEILTNKLAATETKQIAQLDLNSTLLGNLKTLSTEIEALKIEIKTNKNKVQ